MRYFLTFVLGALVGASVVYGLLRDKLTTPVAGVRTAAPVIKPAAVAKTEEERLAERAGIELSPAIANEPMQKTTPPLTPLVNLAPDSIVIPVVDVRREDLRDMFQESRGTRAHGAIDIPAARGTPVVAAIDGTVAKLFLSKPGGITVYQYDPSRSLIYYYAHLDGYAPGLVEGQTLRRGGVIGYVGTSGNARPDAPHLHFSIEKLHEPGKWWKSDPINPYPILTSRGVTIRTAATSSATP